MTGNSINVVDSRCKRKNTCEAARECVNLLIRLGPCVRWNGREEQLSSVSEEEKQPSIESSRLGRRGTRFRL